MYVRGGTPKICPQLLSVSEVKTIMVLKKFDYYCDCYYH